MINPEQFDIILADNAHGDIISDLSASYIGGMGMAPSGDIGDDHAMFQPSHGTAPTIAGMNIVNPTATILSGKMMLEWLGKRYNDVALKKGAELIDKAVYNTFDKGIRTGAFILTTLIILSTMFLKQHSIADVATGITCAVATYVLFYSRAAEKQGAKAKQRSPLHQHDTHM